MLTVFRATDAQLQRMAKLVAEEISGKPMPDTFRVATYKPGEAEYDHVAMSFQVCYGVKGVGLFITHEPDGKYGLFRSNRSPFIYQKWFKKYPTARSLLEAAGITEIDE